MTRAPARWLLLFFAACVRAPPPPAPPPTPPPPPPIVVPAGCEVDLSGPYVHTRDPRFRYLAADVPDGGALVLEVFVEPLVDAGRPPRRFSRDGGLPWLVRTDAGAPPVSQQDAGGLAVAVLRLSRTPSGFLGTSTPLADAGCAFPLRLTACHAGALVLESPAHLAPDCSPLDAGWVRQLLLSPDAGLDTARHIGEEDGGLGDGGDVSVPPSR